MKTFLSLPINKEFYSIYSRLVRTLRKVGVLVQFLSAATEIGVIFTITNNAIADFAPSLSMPVGFVLAAFGTCIIELGLRELTPQAVDSILYRRFKGLHFYMSLFVLIGTVALLTTSTILSFKGSKEIVNNLPIQIEQKNSFLADSIKSKESFAILKESSKDSLNIVQRNNLLISNKVKAFDASISSSKSKLKGFLLKEQKTSKDYSTMKQRLHEEIENLKAEKAKSISILEAEKVAELKELSNNVKENLRNVNDEHDKSVNKVMAFNDKETLTAENKTSRYGGGLAYFTVVCQLLFILSITLDRIHKKGSGIIEQPELTNKQFNPSLASEMTTALSERFDTNLRTRIRAFSDATKDEPKPNAPKALFSVKEAENPVVSYRFEGDGVPHEVLLPNPNYKKEIGIGITEDEQAQITEYVEISNDLQKAGQTDKANDYQLKAESIVKAYLQRNKQTCNESEVKAFTNSVKEFVTNQTTVNPFDTIKNPIGFFNTNVHRYNGELSKEPLKAESKGNVRNCLHCNNEFTFKHWNKKYCNDDCKSAFHAEKHGGTPYKPYYKGK